MPPQFHKYPFAGIRIILLAAMAARLWVAIVALARDTLRVKRELLSRCYSINLLADVTRGGSHLRGGYGVDSRCQTAGVVVVIGTRPAR